MIAKNFHLLIVLSLFIGSISSAEVSETVPVVGTNPNGQAVVVEVPKQEYSQRLTAATSTVNDSMIDAIDLTSSKSTQWHLRTIAVGLGVNMEFGIGIFKIGALPRVRLLFTNSTKPPLP
jgi:hypothetical protein